MLIYSKNGYDVKHPHDTGGKAGKGNNKTSTVQIFKGNQVIKQIRYEVHKKGSYEKALDKAKKFTKISHAERLNSMHLMQSMLSSPY